MFSLKEILNIRSQGRYYDANYKGAVFTPIQPFRRGVEHAYQQTERPFAPDRETATIAILRKLWPGVEISCYVAPIEADFIADIEAKGLLEGFAGSIVGVARQCDSFVDFAIPSALTTDPMMTYDGAHFVPEANRRVTAALLAEGNKMRKAVSAMEPERYTQVYRAALAALMEK